MNKVKYITEVAPVLPVYDGGNAQHRDLVLAGISAGLVEFLPGQLPTLTVEGAAVARLAKFYALGAKKLSSLKKAALLGIRYGITTDNLRAHLTEKTGDTELTVEDVIRLKDALTPPQPPPFTPTSWNDTVFDGEAKEQLVAAFEKFRNEPIRVHLSFPVISGGYGVGEIPIFPNPLPTHKAPSNVWDKLSTDLDNKVF